MKKGFTLIELLAVIVILAIILVIAVPKIMDVINDVKINAYISNEKMVEKAANLYISTNVDRLPAAIGDTTEIKINDLISESYLKPISNPDNKSNTCNGYVLVTKINDSEYDYTPHIKCGNSNTITTASQDGLVAYWKLDGNALDYSMNSNDGTIYGTLPTQNRFGTTNAATRFNPGSNYISFGNDASLNPTSGITVSAWIYWNSNTTQWEWLVAKNSNSSAGDGYMLYKLADADEIGFAINGLSANISRSSFTAGNWYHLVGTAVAGGFVRLYVNGVLVKSSGPVPNPIRHYNNSLGINKTFYYGSPYLFNGAIDDVRIYNRALSQEEITFLYKNVK